MSCNPWTAAHLFISKAVCGAIQLPNIHTVRLGRANRTSCHDDAVASHKCLICHPGVDELGPVVHFKLPLLRSAVLFHVD